MSYAKSQCLAEGTTIYRLAFATLLIYSSTMVSIDNASLLSSATIPNSISWRIGAFATGFYARR
ncbi:hypothetical protein [Erwinia sp. ErVv1]|uniref:hypothetical protein n=1 Tax=Erwinia sp. ErVv1 TaxID=1603299 RepID=UPI00082C2E93|nr:hypothetical protein [Erwinia sp. ErVv1]